MSVIMIDAWRPRKFKLARHLPRAHGGVDEAAVAVESSVLDVRWGVAPIAVVRAE